MGITELISQQTTTPFGTVAVEKDAGVEDFNQRLLSDLVKRGLLKKNKIQEIRDLGRRSGAMPLEKLLVEGKYVRRTDVLAVKSELYGVVAVDLSTYPLEVSVGHILPQATSRRYGVLCIGREGHSIVVAMVEPTDAFATDYIKMRTGFELDIRVGYVGDIEEAQNRVYAVAPEPGLMAELLADKVGQEVMKTRSPEPPPRWVVEKTPPAQSLRRIPLVAEAPILKVNRDLPPLDSAYVAPHASSRVSPVTSGPLSGAPPEPVKLRRSALPDPTPREEVTFIGGRLPSAPPEPVSKRSREASIEVPSRPAPPAQTERSEVTLRIPAGTPPPRVDSAAVARMEKLCEIVIDLNRVLDEDVVIDKIMDTAAELFDVEASSLLLLDKEQNKLLFREARGSKRRELLELTLPLDESSIAGWVTLHRQPACVLDAASDSRHNQEVDDTLEYATRNLLAVPVMWGEEVLGVFEVLNRRYGEFDEGDMRHLSMLASQMAICLHNAMAMKQLHNFFHQTIELLIDCYQAYDPVSREHVVNVARLATAMGKEVGLNAQDMETLCYAALLHDIGKIRCDDPMDLRHSLYGVQILQQVTLFSRLIPVVKHHHERFDGMGYPSGLVGDQIPLLARILAVAEEYLEGGPAEDPESESQENLYREEFLRLFGTAFDPALKGPFRRALAALA